jgi:hypothetical protein
VATEKGETAMAKEENEFQKLLSEAPAAPSADTVTVIGALSRTADPARFVLTLPNGQSETLEVAAVKSAKKIAGAIGQSLVELELDAKRVSGDVRKFFLAFNSGNPFKPADGDSLGGGGFGGGTVVPGRTLIWDIAGATGVDRLHAPAPFAAAMPHQVDPAARAALEAWTSPFAGTRTYWNAYNWTADHHTIMKAHTDPQ